MWEFEGLGLLREVVLGGWLVVELRLSEVREGRMKEVVRVVIVVDLFRYKMVVWVVELVRVMVLDLK